MPNTFKHFLASFAWLLALPAYAYDCFPSTWISPPGVGLPYRSTQTESANCKTWWCKLPARQGDLPLKGYWAPQFFCYLNKYESLTNLAAAANRVGAAANPLAQLNTEVAAGAVIPAAGSADEYQFNRAVYLACKDLAANPPTGIVFDPVAPADDPNWCGTAPVPPTSSPEVWWVAKASSAANPAGTRIAYNYLAGVMVETRPQQRVAEYTLCLATAARLVIGTTTWCTFSSSGLWAVAAKKPL
jgi:hypothetical protein